MSTVPIQGGMSLTELIGSRREKHDPLPPPAATKPKPQKTVSPLTNEHVGYCKNCGVVSFCAIEDSCPVCDKRDSLGVEILQQAVEAMKLTVQWIDSLGPPTSWNVDEQREPLHVKHSATALLRTLQGILDREVL